MTETPEVPAASFTWDDIQAAIKEHSDKQAEQHQKELDDLRASLSPGAVLSNVPLHAGGPGTDIAETWSLAEQEAARSAG
jgi:hypothetical protein